MGCMCVLLCRTGKSLFRLAPYHLWEETTKAMVAVVDVVMCVVASSGGNIFLECDRIESGWDAVRESKSRDSEQCKRVLLIECQTTWLLKIGEVGAQLAKEMIYAKRID